MRDTAVKYLHDAKSDSNFVYTYGESRDATLSTAETGGVTVETVIKNSVQSLSTGLNDNGKLYSYLSTHNIKYVLCTVTKLVVSMSNYKGNKSTVIMLTTLLTLNCTRSHIFNVFCYLLIISKISQKKVLVLNEIKMQSTLAIQKVMFLKNPMTSEMVMCKVKIS